MILAALLLAAAPWEAPQRLVGLPDGHRLNLYCTGQGKPTVLLEAGYGATSAAWARVQPLIAAHTRVCSYDRAGMGFSDAGPMPRDGRAVIADLTALIAAAGLKAPFVLVGHSAGGLTMRMFATAHPAWVVGLVLVDSSLEGQFAGQEAAVAAHVAADRRCADAAAARTLPSTDPKLARCTPPLPASLSPRLAAQIAASRLDPAHWRTLASEYESIAGANSAAVAAGPASYGDLPLVVLTAGQTAAANPGWEARHRALAARSTRGRQATIAIASHNVMKDAPQAVADAVAEVAGVEPRTPFR